MPAVTLSPLFNGWQGFSSGGLPLSLGLIYTYQAGTTTPLATYTTNAGNFANSNPIQLDAAGRPPQEIWLIQGQAYKFVVTDALGTSPLTYDNISGVASGAGDLSFSQAAAYAAASVGRKLQQIISPRDAPYGAIGDGVTDDTVAMAAFFADSAGNDCNLENGLTYLVSTGFTIQSGATYRGNSKIKAKDGAAISTPILGGTACSRTFIEQIEIDGNADNGGMGGTSSYGIYLTGGTGNVVSGAYVHDTRNAGLRVDTEDQDIVLGGRYINCGRTGVTDNHGIMIGSSTGVCSNWLINGVYVKNAFRKGIATYGFSPGTCVNGKLVANTVTDCALGGFYIAGDLGTIVGAVGISLTGNIAVDNYVNYEIANCSQVTGSANDSRYTAPAGKYAGWAIEGAQGVEITGGVNDSAPVHGVVLNAANGVNCLNVSVRGMVITNPNQTTAGTGTGVQVTDSTFCTFDVDISDTSGKMTHGILEGTGGNNNSFGSNVRNGTTARISITGTSTRFTNRAGRNTGYNVQDPLNTQHISGGTTMEPQLLTLVNGANNNVALPANAGLLYITGPTGAFSITGFAGGHNGRQLRVYNYTSQTCTISHNSGSSSAGNKIVNKNNVDYTLLTQQGAVFDFLVPVNNAWLSMQG